jgi:ferredoxin
MRIVVNGRVLDIRDEMTLLEVLKNNNVEIKNNCEGNGACGRCLVEFEKIIYELQFIDEGEFDVIEKQIKATKYTRLACQVKIDDLRVIATDGDILIKII